MKYKVIFNSCFLLLLLLMSSIGCKNPEKATIITNDLTDTLLVKESVKRCYCDDSNYIEVYTKYIEVPDTVCECIYGFVTLKQEIKVISGGREYKIINPLYKKQAILIGQDSIIISSTIIISAKCIQKKGKGLLYLLYGSNNTDPPNEFFGLLSKEGRWLWYYYGDKYDTYQEFGDEKVIAKEFGKKDISNLDNMTNLLPK